MSLEELQVRGWVQTWEKDLKSGIPAYDHDSAFMIVAAPAREGVLDFEFQRYPAFRYEGIVDGVSVSFAEGKDAFDRVLQVMKNFVAMRAM